MSPLLFQKLIKTLCLFLLAVAVANSSIFDHIDLEGTLEQLEAQASASRDKRSTTPTSITTGSLNMNNKLN